MNNNTSTSTRSANGIEYKEELATKYADLHTNEIEMSILIPLLMGKKCLDVGCGSGRLLVPLRQKGFDVRGVESSPEMYKACLAAGASEEDVANISANSPEFFNLLSVVKPDLLYLSFSLHQIAPTIDQQFAYLNTLLEYSDVLLITTLPDHFSVNPTTRFSIPMIDIDLLRFPFREWFYTNFDVGYSIDLLVDSPEVRERFLKGIRSKHISTFQLLKDEKEIDSIEWKASNSNYLPQVHSYILLKKTK